MNDLDRRAAMEPDYPKTRPTSSPPVAKSVAALVLAGSILGLSTVVVAWVKSSGRVRARVSGRAMIARATSPVHLRYPAEDVAANRAGVAVIEIRVGLDGRVHHVDVHEAPTAAIAESLRADFRALTFKPIAGTGGKPVVASAKFIVYFTIADGASRVVFASDLVEKSGDRSKE